MPATEPLVFDAIRKLMTPPPEAPRQPIGFRTGKDRDSV